MIPLNVLEKYLGYNPETGVLLWIKDSYNHHKGVTPRAGNNAGKGGQIAINGMYTRTHIAAWTLHYGEQPISYIDFKDGDKHNIKIDNMTDSGSKEGHECGDCGATGGEDVFYLNPYLRSGFSTKCKICTMRHKAENRRYLSGSVDKAVDKVIMPPIVRRSLGLE